MAENEEKDNIHVRLMVLPSLCRDCLPPTTACHLTVGHGVHLAAYGTFPHSCLQLMTIHAFEAWSFFPVPSVYYLTLARTHHTHKHVLCVWPSPSIFPSVLCAFVPLALPVSCNLGRPPAAFRGRWAVVHLYPRYLIH